MSDKQRPYLFYDVAISISSACYRKVEAKTILQDGSVYLLKRCPEHGHERVLIADDVECCRHCRDIHQAAGDAAGVQHAGKVGVSV